MKFQFGDQPETGIMSYKVIPKGLPGFEVNALSSNIYVTSVGTYNRCYN